MSRILNKMGTEKYTAIEIRQALAPIQRVISLRTGLDRTRSINDIGWYLEK